MRYYISHEINRDFNLGISGMAFLWSILLYCESWKETQGKDGVLFVSKASPTQAALASMMAVRSTNTVAAAAKVCEDAGLVSVKRSRKFRRDSESGETFCPSNIYTVSIPARYVLGYEATA